MFGQLNIMFVELFIFLSLSVVFKICVNAALSETNKKIYIVL